MAVWGRKSCSYFFSTKSHHRKHMTCQWPAGTFPYFSKNMKRFPLSCIPVSEASWDYSHSSALIHARRWSCLRLHFLYAVAVYWHVRGRVCVCVYWHCDCGLVCARPSQSRPTTQDNTGAIMGSHVFLITQTQITGRRAAVAVCLPTCCSDVARNWTSISANPSTSLTSFPPRQQNPHPRQADLLSCCFLQTYPGYCAKNNKAAIASRQCALLHPEAVTNQDKEILASSSKFSVSSSQTVYGNFFSGPEFSLLARRYSWYCVIRTVSSQQDRSAFESRLSVQLYILPMSTNIRQSVFY